MHPNPKQHVRADDQFQARATWVYAVVMLGGTGLMLGAMSYFLLVERRIWPMWVFWGVMVLAFVVALVDVRLLRVVVSADAIHIRRAWGSRTIMLADLCEMRYVKFEYVIKPAKGRGRWFWIPRFITHKDELIDRLRREIASNVVGQVSAVTPSQREAVRAGLQASAEASGAPQQSGAAAAE